MSQSSLSATVFPAKTHASGSEWIVLRLKCKDPETPIKIAYRNALRWAFSVDHEVTDMLAEDLQLEFARSVLQVSSTCQDPGRCGAHRGHVQDSLALHKVVGQSLRHARSRFAGRSSKVGAIPQYPGGFARFLEDTVQSAVVCRVSDSVLQ